MTVYCDCEACEYNDDGCYCTADKISLDDVGVCLTVRWNGHQDEQDEP